MATGLPLMHKGKMTKVPAFTPLRYHSGMRETIFRSLVSLISDIYPLVQGRVKDIRRKGQREVEAFTHFGRIRPEAETAKHRIAARVANAEDDALEKSPRLGIDTARTQ